MIEWALSSDLFAPLRDPADGGTSRLIYPALAGRAGLRQHFIYRFVFTSAGSSNGRTGASEALYLGSNPSPAEVKISTSQGVANHGDSFVCRMLMHLRGYVRVDASKDSLLELELWKALKCAGRLISAREPYRL